MDAYIRREDAIKCIEGQCVDGKMWGNDESDEGTLIEAYSAIDDLMEIPPADVAPVRHGRWVKRGCKWQCTQCKVLMSIDGTPKENLLNYCPNCGCLMDGGDDE